MLMLYLADVLPSIKSGFAVASLILLSAGVIIYRCEVEKNIDGEKFEDKKARICKAGNTQLFFSLLFFIIFIVSLVFIPSQKTIYMMIGSHYLSNNELPEKVIKVLNHKLDEIIKDE